MMTGGSINQAQIKTLDYLAAKTAHTIVETAKVSNAPKDIENLITKALGVLQAQGVYAMYLFLYSQAEGEKPATFVLFHLWNALKDPEVPVPLPGNVRVERLQDKSDAIVHQQFTQLPSAREVILTSICNLTADLDTLLLVRDLYERTLIYARYHTKACGG